MWRSKARHLCAAVVLAGAVPVLADAPSEAEEKSVVIVLSQLDNGISQGSGFLVAPGRIVTNEHVVRDGRAFAVLPPLSSQQIPARVLWSDADRDMALLEVGDFGAKPLSLALAPATKHEKVWAVGFGSVSVEWQAANGKWDNTPSDGIVQGIFEMPWGTNNRPMRILQHSADITHGNSGGPLFDGCGRVVGINTAGPNIPVRTFLAAPIEVLKTGLEGAGQHVPFNIDPRPCKPDGTLAAPASSVTAATPSVAGPVGGTVAWAKARFGNQPPWVYAAAGLFLLSGAALLVRRVAAPARRGDAGPPPVAAASLPTAALAQPAEDAPAAPLMLRPLQGGAVLPLDRAALSRRFGVTLGRSPDFCDHVVTGDKVSRRHVRLTVAGGRLHAEDLNSAHGTMIGPVALLPFEPRQVMSGDVLTIGDRAFRHEG